MLRRSKYKNANREYNGVMYHSRAEADYAELLELRKKNVIGVDSIADWERQVPVKLVVNGILVTTYIVDFVVTHHDGRKEWIEIKGYPTAEWKIKEKLFRALYPERKLTVVGPPFPSLRSRT